MNNAMLQLLIFAMLLSAVPCQVIAQVQWEQKHVSHEADVEDAFAEHTFVFTNISQNPLEVVSVKASCGCTHATILDRKIPAGGQGSLRVRFDFEDRVGTQRKRITLRLSAGGSESQVENLTYTVTIPEVARVSPKLLRWRSDELSERRSIRFEPLDGREITITSWKCNSDDFIIKLKREDEKTGIYSLEVTPRSDAPAQLAKLKINTDFPAQNPRSYTAYLRVE